MTRTSKTTLDDLPDEVVLEVINWLVLATKKTKYPPIAKKFSILYVLSQVNRRFRIILKPILCRDLQFDDHMAFHLAEENFRDGVYDYGHLVKCVVLVSLSRFSRLRKVALHWPLESFEWLEPYESDNRPQVDFIDDVCPPLDLLNHEIPRLDTAYPDDVWQGKGIENNIRSVLDLTEECNKSLDEEEEHIAMRAWRILHDQDIRPQMEALAKSCPLLEEIEWYPMWRPFDACVRWHWQVVRAKDGTITRLKDELTWPGCIRGNPPPMLMLVGEELEYIKRSGLGRWRPI